MQFTDFKQILNIFDDTMEKKLNFKEIQELESKVYGAFLDDLIEEGKPISDDFNEKEYLLTDYSSAYEQQGFINGFRYAMNLSKELK